MKMEGVAINENVLAAMVDCTCKSAVDATNTNLTAIVNKALSLIYDAQRSGCGVNAWVT
jgi:hypothetical protein